MKKRKLCELCRHGLGIECEFENKDKVQVKAVLCQRCEKILREDWYLI